MGTIGRMGRPTVQLESPFQVARIRAIGGSAGAPEAFRELEDRMDSLRGSKMYGVLYPGDPLEYFACLKLEGDRFDGLGLELAEVLGGLYGRRLIRDWESKISELPQIFDRLNDDLADASFLIDATRPSLEFYRRSNELVIMMPVVPGSLP